MTALKTGIATFNAENLIGPNKPIYNESRNRYTDSQYIEKTKWINYQISSLNASIIGFQEVFEESALRDCLSSDDNWNIIVSPGSEKLPKNALISKYPILQHEHIETIPDSFQYFDEFIIEKDKITLPISNFSRAILKAKLKITEQQNLNVLVVHLKSKKPILPNELKRDTAPFYELAAGSVRSLIRRSIEACGLRKIISDTLQADGKTPLVVLGDFNDDTHAVTNQVILGEAPYYSLEPIIREKRWNEVLQNARVIQARKSIESYIYSYIHNGHYECLDNIMLSNHFSDLNKNRIGKVIDVRTFNDHLFDDSLCYEKQLTKTDHGQVVAFIEFKTPDQLPTS